VEQGAPVLQEAMSMIDKDLRPATCTVLSQSDGPLRTAPNTLQGTGLAQSGNNLAHKHLTHTQELAHVVYVTNPCTRSPSSRREAVHPVPPHEHETGTQACVHTSP
jgi:hypothetical protein